MPFVVPILRATIQLFPNRRIVWNSDLNWRNFRLDSRRYSQWSGPFAKRFQGWTLVSGLFEKGRTHYKETICDAFWRHWRTIVHRFWTGTWVEYEQSEWSGRILGSERLLLLFCAQRNSIWIWKLIQFEWSWSRLDYWNELFTCCKICSWKFLPLSSCRSAVHAWQWSFLHSLWFNAPQHRLFVGLALGNGQGNSFSFGHFDRLGQISLHLLDAAKRRRLLGPRKFIPSWLLRGPPTWRRSYCDCAHRKETQKGVTRLGYPHKYTCMVLRLDHDDY